MIKVLYLTYENLFRNPVLQSMVINPLSEISKKYNVNYIITSSVKSFEKDEIYYKNKKSTKKLPGIEVIEFEKTINDKQSYLNFAKVRFLMMLQKTNYQMLTVLNLSVLMNTMLMRF